MPPLALRGGAGVGNVGRPQDLRGLPPRHQHEQLQLYLQRQCELLCNRGYHAAILDYRGTGGMRLDATSPPVAGAADSWKVGIWG